MFGGDEVGAVVLDIGSHTTKGGLAGEDQPKSVFPTAIGTYFASDYDIHMEKKKYDFKVSEPKSEEAEGGGVGVGAPPGTDSSLNNSNNIEYSRELKKRYIAGPSMALFKQNKQIEQPVQHGIIHNWDAIEHNIEYAFCNHLRLNSSEHPFLCSEPSFVSNSQREKLLSILFQRFNSPGVFMSPSAVLAAFASGRSTALVFDSGAGQTTATPVHDGYVLGRGTRKSLVAGNALDEMMENLIFKRAFPDKQCVPLYCLKKEWNSLTDSIRIDKVELEGVTESFHRFHQLEIIRDIKESVCKISETGFERSGHIKLPPQSYTLPDGTTLDISNERFIAGDLLFLPHLVNGVLPSQYESSTVISNITPFHGFHRLIISCIESVDADLRKDLYSNLILTGGTTLLPGLAARLSKEITANIAPVFKCKILPGPTTVEKKFGVWIGGSILGSLGSFHQMWISRAEFNEHGPQIVHRKCQQ